MRTGLAYTSARILLLVASLVVLYLAGARGIVLLALAFVVSALASYVLLSRQRDAMSSALSRRLARKAEQAGQAASAPAAEDAAETGKARAPRWRWAAEFRARLEEGAAAEDVDDEEPAAPAPDAPASEAQARR